MWRLSSTNLKGLNYMSSRLSSNAPRWRGRALLFFLALLFCAAGARAADADWSATLDGEVRFYQTTELGVVVVGTEKSLYAVGGETGEVLWRRKGVELDETDVAPVPGTDMLLLNLEKGSKARVEAVDLFTGDALWQSDK